MIPEHVVDEVRARVDLVEIIGEQVSLKRAGKEFRGLCPFHHEKTPSFYVVPAKGFYKCFGCGESGDAFTFLMKRQGLSFTEAVRAIADKVGVEIPEQEQRQQDEPHRALFEANAFAADFYQRHLWEEPLGERARAYLKQRELSREVAERFGLGYAPDGWRGLREAAHKHGIEDAVLLEAGLIKQGDDKDKEPYDRLRDRLIFPIADLAGRWIGFGGRILGKSAEGMPKYLNSPETPIYHKGRTLYGLNWSRTAIRREHVALVVEGYMDYVSLAARGIENVVAALGTAMTEEQATLLARYTKQVMMLYDSDTAGLKATFRTGDALLRAGIEPLVVSLPEGEDPDSVARKGGANALAVYLAKAVDVLDRKMQILQERQFFDDIEGVRRALDRLLPTLRAAADPALKDIYVDRVAKRTGVRRETLERELTSDRPFRPERPARPERVPTRESRTTRAELRDREWAAEKLLMTLLMRDPERIEQARQVVTPDQLRDSAHQQIYRAMLQHGPLPDEPPATFGLSALARQRIEELRADPREIIDGDRNFDNAVGSILLDTLQLKILETKRRMKLVSETEQTALLNELAQLTIERNAIAHKAGIEGRYVRRSETSTGEMG